MAKPKDVVAEPVRDGGIEFVELAGKEVINSLHKNQMIIAGKGCNEVLDALSLAELVVAAVDKQFRFVALAQKRKIHVVDGKTHAHQVRDPRMLATDAQTHPRTKTESRQQDRHTRELSPQKVDRRAHVIPLTDSAVMFARAQPRAAKIESQHGEAEGSERFRRLIDHFVVHRAAEKRMRVANDGGKRRPLVRRPGRSPENRFEASRGTLEKKTARSMGSGHRCASESFSV